MIEIKTWLVSKEQFDQNDLIWLQSSGCEFRVKEYEPIEISVFGKSSLVMPRSPELYVNTTCSKQETMLQLKYSGFLHLVGTHTDIHTL